MFPERPELRLNPLRDLDLPICPFKVERAFRFVAADIRGLLLTALMSACRLPRRLDIWRNLPNVAYEYSSHRERGDSSYRL